MTYQVHALVQGTPEWCQFRLDHFGASEAAAMLGMSLKVKRDELLRMKAMGMAKEFSDWVQENVLDYGHEVEALARPLAEEIVGSDLYPCTCSDGDYSASCDGLTMDDSIAFEHKQLSQRLVDLVSAGIMPDEHIPQCQQVLMVTGAEKLLFVASDGTRKNFHYLWVYPDQEWFKRLRAGWAQFAKDMAAWTPDANPVAEPKPTGKAPATLPALLIELKGEVTASNLDEFKDVALTAIRSVNRDLKTDQDFADSAKARKWCEDIEARVKATKEHAMAQTATIDMLFKALDEISEEARTTRLALKKTEDARTLSINSELVADGIAKFRAHIDALNATMPAPYMPKIAADFGGCIAKLRSVDSKRNAVNTELARAKIEADEAARRILFNLRILDARPDLAHLFNDRTTIVLKQPEDLGVLVKLRITEHEAAEAKKAETLRASIAAEEKEKAEKKARDELAAQQVADAAAAPAPVAAPAPAETVMVVSSTTATSRFSTQDFVLPGGGAVVDAEIRPGTVTAPASGTGRVLIDLLPADPVDNGKRITLGQIKEHISPLTISAEGLAEIGYPHVATDKSAKLYRACDLPEIIGALVARLQAVQHQSVIPF